MHALHALRTLYALSALHALRALHTLSALHALAVLIPLRTLHALDALHTLRTLHALSTLHTLRALHAMDTLHTLWALHALSTMHALRSLHALDTLHTLRSLDALSTLHTLWTLHALHTLRSLNALDTLHTLWTLHALSTLHSLRPLYALYTLYALRALQTLTVQMALHPGPLPAVYAAQFGKARHDSDRADALPGDRLNVSDLVFVELQFQIVLVHGASLLESIKHRTPAKAILMNSDSPKRRVVSQTRRESHRFKSGRRRNRGTCDCCSPAAALAPYCIAAHGAGRQARYEINPAATRLVYFD